MARTTIDEHGRFGRPPFRDGAGGSRGREGSSCRQVDRHGSTEEYRGARPAELASFADVATDGMVSLPPLAPTTALPPPPPMHLQSIGAQLGQVAELHSSGVLSDAELEAAKVGILRTPGTT